MMPNLRMLAVFLALLIVSADAAPSLDLLPGMPPPLDPRDVYAAARPGKLSPVVSGFPERVYVPLSGDDAVDVIDPRTFKVIERFAAGKQPQHVTPSYDLKTLYALNDLNDTLTRIDPATGHKVDTLNVRDPYNMYYTPDGRFAIVVAERLHRLDFREAQTMKLVESLVLPCRGVDHMDFSLDGRYLIASCEFSSDLVKVDVATHKLIGTLKLPGHAMPQDVRVTPDGSLFYVADMDENGVHGLYFSRDSKWLYVSNRGEGSVALIDVAAKKVATKWTIPGGGSPDMGGVSADGKVLWLSGRYHAEVYAFDTTDGHLLARIKVGKGPHGLCVYPQPGRYSLGHTGNMR